MELKFKNGKFRIMQIADVQDTQRTSDATVRFIREALKKAQPDLVVFTGDQVKGYGFNLMGGDNKKKVTECINKLLTPLDETGIPFTFVFGNHDDQAFSISKKEQSEIYGSHENCVALSAFTNESPVKTVSASAPRNCRGSVISGQKFSGIMAS